MKSLQLVVRFISILFIILLILNLIGCAAIKVPTTLVRPGEVNMINFKEVVVLDVAGKKGKDISEAISQAIVDTGRFKLLDRENLPEISAEGNLDPTAAKSFGEIHPASAIIVGRVSDVHCNQNLDTTTRTKDGITNTIYTRHAEAAMTVSLKVIDISTAEILATKRLPKTKIMEKTGYNEKPPLFDEALLHEDCIKQVVQGFMTAINPRQESRIVVLYKNEKSPDTTLGISYMYLGEYEKALESFKKTVEELNLNPKHSIINRSNIKKSRALYNLGVALEYSNKFDEAIENLKEAFTLYRGNIGFFDEFKDECEEIFVLQKKDVYLNEISFCETKKSEFEALKEQEVF